MAVRGVRRPVAGHTEWGVKAYATGSATEAGPPQSGADYLRRRRDELSHRDTVNQEVWDAAQRVFHELGMLSAAQRRHQPQDAKPSGRSEPMLLNGSFLIEDSEQDSFTKTMSTLAATASSTR